MLWDVVVIIQLVDRCAGHAGVAYQRHPRRSAFATAAAVIDDAVGVIQHSDAGKAAVGRAGSRFVYGLAADCAAAVHKVDGPRSTSIRSTRIGSTLLAWSGLKLDASLLPRPFCITRTRGPDYPRITGVPTPAPNDWQVMPSSFFSVSPMVWPIFVRKASSDKTVTGRADFEPVFSNGDIRYDRSDLPRRRCPGKPGHSNKLPHRNSAFFDFFKREDFVRAIGMEK